MKKIIIICLSFLLLNTTSTEAARKTRKPSDPKQELKDKLNRFIANYRPQEDGQRVRSGSKLSSLIINDTLKTVDVIANSHFGEQVFTPQAVSTIYEAVRKLLPDTLSKYQLSVKTGGWDLWQLVPVRLMPGNANNRTWGDIDYEGNPWVYNTSKPYRVSKGLQNRHLSLWASHGRYFHVRDSVWKWQRPPLFGTREDLFTQTIVTPYLIPMLENAGAIVFTPRERDWQRHEVIVDNDTPKSGYQ